MCIMSCLAKKKKRKRRCFRSVCHLLLGNWQAIHQSTHGKWWVITFASLVLFSSILFHFPSLINVFFFFFFNLDPQVFLLLFFLSSSPILLGVMGRSEQEAVFRGLSRGLAHDNCQSGWDSSIAQSLSNHFFLENCGSGKKFNFKVCN